MITSFNDEETRKLYYTEKSPRFANITRVALRKLIQLTLTHNAIRYSHEADNAR